MTSEEGKDDYLSCFELKILSFIKSVEICDSKNFFASRYQSFMSLTYFIVFSNVFISVARTNPHVYIYSLIYAIYKPILAGYLAIYHDFRSYIT